MNLFKKILGGWLIVFVIFGGLFLVKLEKAGAQIPGVPQPVIVINPVVVFDPTHTSASVGGWIAQAARFSLEQAQKIFLAGLKKRLLDTLVDQIIGYIQGNGKPKFVQDFGGTLKNAADQISGDIIRESTLADICSPFKLSFRVGLLEPSPFSQRISCTLSDVVGNIGDFMDDFSEGGWVGYHELLKPQNNIYGALIIADDEKIERTARLQEALTQEVTVGQGFLGIKKCLEWTFYGNDNYGEPVADTFPVNSSNFDYEDPNKTPPIPDGYFGDWKCSKPVITTPGGAIAKGLEKALYSDLDFILTADELSQYIGAIADAAINRLIKESVRGVQGLTPSRTTTGRSDSQTSRGEPITFDSSTSTQGAIDNYIQNQTNILNSTRNTYLGTLNNAIAALNNASSSLTDASVQNQNLIVVLNNLIICLTGHSQNTAWADNALANASTTTVQIIQSAASQINSLKERTEGTRDIINDARTLNDLNGIDQNQITGWLTNSNNLEIQANDILNQVEITKNDAENRLQQCLAGP